MKNLQNIRTVTLSFFCLCLTHFVLIFSGGLGISVFWGLVSLFCISNQVLGNSMSCKIVGDVGF